MEKRINFCCVCGYDLSQENEFVDRYVMCNCCGFHYGFDDVGQKEPFYYYRKNWLSQNKSIVDLHNLGINNKEDLVKQLENIKNYLQEIKRTNIQFLLIDDFYW
jgi:hypothetical protein